MAQILRQSTAVDILIGPFVNVTNGKTAEAGLTIAQANVRLSKAAQNIAQKSDVTTCVYDEVGMYNCELDATDTDTVGTLDLIVDDALALTVVNRFQVIDAVTYDALYADTPTLLTSKDIGQLYESAITTVTGQQEFVMTVAIAVDDTWIGNVCSLEDVSTGEIYSGKAGTGIWISDVVASTNTLYISTVFPVTVVAGDVVRIHVDQHPTYALTSFDPATATNLASDTASVLAKLLAYVQLLARSDAFITTDKSVELGEINTDEGSGGGNFAATSDSLEAQADVCAEVKVKTDQMVYTKANELDVNTVSINQAEVVGDGNATPWDGA